MIKFVSLTFVATLAFLMLVTGGAASLQENLVLYLDFDEEGAEIVKDLSPAGNDATVWGDVKWVQGKHGLALEFSEEEIHLDPQDEDTQYLFIADTPSLDFDDQPFTIAAWVNIETTKVEGVGDEETLIISKKGFGFNDNYTNYGIFINRGGAGVVQFCIGDMTACQRILFKEKISANEWYHLAITFDPDSDEVNYYLNGSLEETVASLIEPVADEESPVYIGTQPTTDLTRFFNGKMDDLAVFNRVLTENEVTGVMSGRIASVSPSGNLSTTWGWLKRAK